MEQDGDDDGWWACAVIESAAGDAIIDILTTQLLRGDLKLMPLFPTILSYPTRLLHLQYL